MELISLSDSFAHVENCTEKHFMELLEGTERICQRKLISEKKIRHEIQKITHTHTQKKSQPTNYSLNSDKYLVI